MEEVLKLLPCKGFFINNPATSCKEILDCDSTAPSGYYWANTTTGPLQVYCQMDTNNCGNITGGWMRAAYIDMTEVSNTCPQGLTYTAQSSIHMCTSSHSTAGCTSVNFPTHGVPYTKVCGRALAYQRGANDGFYNYHQRGQSTINGYYVDGLILEATSGPLYREYQKMATTPSITAPVPSTLGQLHLHLWVKITFVSLVLVETINLVCGFLMTLCGTHRGV